MSGTRNYTLKVGEAGAPRLTLLNELCNPYTFAFINKVTTLENKRILDVGCGIGILSCAFALFSLPKGSVLGVDASEEQVQLAEARAKKENSKNIRFQTIAAEKIDQLGETFDIIYFRFTLMHLKNANDVLAKTRLLMHADSILICEEASDIQALCCNPPDQAFTKWKQAVEKQVELSNSDFTIGKKLKDVLLKQQLTPVYSETVQPVMETSRLKQQLWQGILEIGALLIGSGFCPAEDIETLVAELKVFADTSTAKVGFFSYLQVVAKKSSLEEEKSSCSPLNSSSQPRSP